MKASSTASAAGTEASTASCASAESSAASAEGSGAPAPAAARAPIQLHHQASVAARGELLGMLSHRKEATNPINTLAPLKDEHEMGKNLRASVHGGTEEWRKHRAFKARLGEALRAKFEGKALEKEVASWSAVGNDDKIGKKDFDRAMTNLGFSVVQSGDLTEVTQLFNSMKRDMRDKHIHIKECHKSRPPQESDHAAVACSRTPPPCPAAEACSSTEQRYLAAAPSSRAVDGWREPCRGWAR